MEEVLKNYLTGELELVNERIEKMETDIRQKMAMMNLELGKIEGILIAQRIRRDELLQELGLQSSEGVKEEYQDEPEVIE